MEQQTTRDVANRIKVSQFGLQFLTRLPEQLQELQQTNNLNFDQQNLSILHYQPIRRGKALDFHHYASQTQQQMFKKTSQLLKNRQLQTQNSESKRKLQLHHQHWQSEQKLISHKLSDTHARLLHDKFSEYDWKSVNRSLKQSSHNILDPLQVNSNNRNIRTRSKLKRLLVRKYPNRVSK